MKDLTLFVENGWSNDGQRSWPESVTLPYEQVRPILLALMAAACYPAFHGSHVTEYMVDGDRRLVEPDELAIKRARVLLSRIEREELAASDAEASRP